MSWRSFLPFFSPASSLSLSLILISPFSTFRSNVKRLFYATRQSFLKKLLCSNIKKATLAPCTALCTLKRQNFDPTHTYTNAVVCMCVCECAAPLCFNSLRKFRNVVAVAIAIAVVVVVVGQTVGTSII